jgi:DNA-binding FrmR family transcriptional regulator
LKKCDEGVIILLIPHHHRGGVVSINEIIDGGCMVSHKNDAEALNYLKTARGQIDGILKMIDDQRYCIDISKQIFAVQSLLKKANMKILKDHMHSCVASAVSDGSGDEKIEEIIYILEKFIDRS